MPEKRLDLGGKRCGRRSPIRGISLGAVVLVGLLTARTAQPAIKNGDMDLNAVLNISDAVILLQVLFVGDSPPIPVVLRKGLPTTGQDQCYDDAYPTPVVIPCPSSGEPYYGQDGNYPGIPHDYEVVKPVETDPSTWYTIDYSTALMWQYQNPGQRKTWPEALQYAEDLVLGGFDDWRVPNMTELLSIVDFDRDPPFIDTDFFDVIIEEPWYHTFWTSTTPCLNRSEAFVISFKYGTFHFSSKDPGYKPDYVRAVRTIRRAEVNGDINGDGEIDISDPVRLILHLFGSSLPPAPLKQVIGLPITVHCEPPYDPEEPECLFQGGSDQVGMPRDFELVKPDPEDSLTWYTIDHATGLMWQYDEPLEMKNWRAALAYCEDLELGGFGDWRLPSVKELQSIINYGKAHPAIDTQFFGKKSYALEWRDNWAFWSATPHYTVFMDIGLIADSYTTSGSWVRAVRTIPHEDE